MKKWLYLIADFSYGEARIEAALKAGIDYIQLREKDISSAEYLLRAKRMREITDKYRTRLIINDRLDIALLSGADGVHLGQEDVPVKDARKLLGARGIIGATAKTPEQAKQARIIWAAAHGFLQRQRKMPFPFQRRHICRFCSPRPFQMWQWGELMQKTAENPFLWEPAAWQFLQGY